MTTIKTFQLLQNGTPKFWTLCAFLLIVISTAIYMHLAQRPSDMFAVAIVADPPSAERLGKRLMVGFRDIEEAKVLVEKRAIAGLYVSKRNIRDRSWNGLAKDLRVFQKVRSEQGLPPLIIAADQEGGTVSHLSPPIPPQPSLQAILSNLGDLDARKQAVAKYARQQALGLKQLGVTLNLAPVVDLKPASSSSQIGSASIGLRAIGSDPELVADVADWYCASLLSSGISCALKHFPGLGRVDVDTHSALGTVSATKRELEASDWIPFRRLARRSETAIMLGHVKLEGLHMTQPASISKEIATKLLRDEWQATALTMTDDMGMGAIEDIGLDVGKASVSALNAGVDLVLVSIGSKHYRAVLSAFREAERNSQIDSTTEAQSVKRLRGFALRGQPSPSLN